MYEKRYSETARLCGQNLLEGVGNCPKVTWLCFLRWKYTIEWSWRGKCKFFLAYARSSFWNKRTTLNVLTSTFRYGLGIRPAGCQAVFVFMLKQCCKKIAQTYQWVFDRKWLLSSYDFFVSGFLVIYFSRQKTHLITRKILHLCHNAKQTDNLWVQAYKRSAYGRDHKFWNRKMQKTFLILKKYNFHFFVTD